MGKIKKIECRREDGTTIWLQPHIANNKARQRQMGFIVVDQSEPMADVPPLDEEKKEVEAVNEEAPAETAFPPLENLGEQNGEESVEKKEVPAEEEKKDAPEEKEEAPAETEKPKFSVQVSLARETYKEQNNGKYPPDNWKLKTIKSKLK